MDPKQDLNPQQREAVLHRGRPLLILAGAGSGKTRALTHRVAHLVLKRGVPAWRILAITFTNKAAEEMRVRVRRLLAGQAAPDMWIGTFHATCARILRQHIERLDYDRNFVIYDQADQMRVIKACLKGLSADASAVRPAAVRALLEKAKNQAVPPASVIPDDSAAHDLLAQVLEDYASFLREANALDFGDLITLTLQLFDEHPDVLADYRERFRSVLVDEYQDTNRAQHLLLKHLVPPGGDLCVVGDDDQSIYRWRGADVNNLLDFEADFPGTRVLTLDQNYRSTGNILKAAQAVAQENPRRREKGLWTQREAGPPIVYTEAATPDGEARLVVREILALAEREGTTFRDVAVFFRTNAQSRAFEEQFVLERIPHVVIGSLRFYERAEVKDMLAYLRFLYNPRDTVSLLRILNRPARGIGKVTQDHLEAHAHARGCTLWEGIEQGLRAGAFPRATENRIGPFAAVVRNLLARVDTDAPDRLLQAVQEETGYMTYLLGQEDAERRRENMEEMVRTATAFGAQMDQGPGRDLLGAFLERISLVTDVDAYDARADCVSLMTLHCAKGLEFPVVFLTGLEKGLLPHQRSLPSPEAMAEERRLCYVGMTRAKDRLYLSRSIVRSLYGESQFTEPSPFLASLPTELVEVRARPEGPDHAPPVREEPAHAIEGDSFLDYSETQLDMPPPPKRPRKLDRVFALGDMLEHESLGRGIVRKVEGSGAGEKVTVQFVTGGIRKLMVQVSPVRKIQ